MKHTFEQKVYYSDTDAYGVVWHGSYLRWLEMGRVEFCEQMGHDLIELKNNDIVLPVTNMSVRYKASAKLNDTVIIETKILKISPITITFSQTIKEKNTEKTFIIAEFDIVAIHNNGILYRRLPEILKKSFEEALLCQD